MNTVTYLEMQLANIHTLLHDIVSDINEQEWQARPATGQNRTGYNVWHIPRIQDHVVQLWIRGGSEIFHQPTWAHWQMLRPLGVGVGITLADADEIATKVSLAETLVYADAVHQEILTWLRQCSDDDLDQVPDALAHLAPYPEYQTSGYCEEVESLIDQPMWSLLMRPCIGHVHRHLGELEVIKAVLRAR